MAALRKALGLDLPAHERYLRWLGGLLSGDPGVSLINRLPVAQLIGPRLANSLLLTALTAAVAVPLALLIGITTAIWRGTLYDRVANVAAVSLVAVPEFLLATVGVMLFAVQLRWVSAIANALDRLVRPRRCRTSPCPSLTLVLRRDGADGAHDPRRAARRARFAPISRWRG